MEYNKRNHDDESQTQFLFDIRTKSGVLLRPIFFPVQFPSI
jgi:hypothetical protein